VEKKSKFTALGTMTTS